MSKIFRLYKEGSTTYEDWNNSPAFPYNSTSRDTIEDPDGASARHEITSIPSPFARIDLIKNAFKEVCKSVDKNGRVDLDGNTIFHKMVSDTLDVAEIFFNIDKYNGKVEIIKWDPGLMLNELEASDIDGHRYLADALRKYMKSDRNSYNFSALNNIYLLNYTSGPDELNIIGATSPATLFFSTANNLSYVNDIFFGDDIPFDSDFQPLYKRDFEFVKYLFALRKTIHNFAGLFPEVDSYLNVTFKAIKDPDKKSDLLSLSASSLDDYDQLEIKEQMQSDIVEVLGHTLYKKSVSGIKHPSDFYIKSDLQTENLPLVLPVEAGNRYSDLQYTTAKWGRTNKASFVEEEKDITKRILPYDGSVHPYLTISDFLESTIVRVPHTLNEDNYFAGNIKNAQPEEAFLLPLKPLFFRYFTVAQLQSSMSDGKPMIEMSYLAGGSIKVIIRIPISGSGRISYIEYERLYYNGRLSDAVNNEGNIVELKFTGFIMPQVKFNASEDAVYNVSCVQSMDGKVEFKFYNNELNLAPTSMECRNEAKEYLSRADNYLIKESNFDYIQVRNEHGASGVLIPIFHEQKSIEKFEFAIDLGTSNTHIEFKKGNDQPRVFSFNNKDRQLCEMFIPTRNEHGNLEDLIEESSLIEKDFLPDEVGNGDFAFPTRTVLSCAKTVDWSKTVQPYSLVNLPFTYDKRSDLPYNNLKYNIKWGKGDDLMVMVAYVRTLMLMLRNKVLLNNGDLKSTKITWFYPISMAPNRLRKLRETWDEAYNEYFGEGETSNISESVAPIQYFFRRYSTATDLVNVDIGGGTTDIAFAKDRKILYVTSFRFASNALFQDSYSDLTLDNGIVDRYKEYFLNLIESKSLLELVEVFNSENNQNPANMASFLFGLKDNTILKNAGLNAKAIDFNYLLQEDEQLKIVFIVFYTAIIYHIAQIVKNLELETPRHISFSGNGSKVIRVITTDTKILAKYTKLIFEKVLDRPYGKELELIGLEKDSNPKDATCKGGLIGSEDDEDVREKAIVFKSDNSGLVTENDTYANIDSSYRNKTVKAVRDFFKFVFEEMPKSFNFDKNFGVDASAMKVARGAAEKDLATYLEKGLTERREETEADDTIEETLFFYPIKGVLQKMSQDIYSSLQ